MGEHLSHVLITTLVVGAFLGAVFFGSQCEIQTRKMQREAFTACVQAGRPPAECRLSTTDTSR